LQALQHTPLNPVLHSLNWFSGDVVSWINASNYDVVNLHWVSGTALSVEDIGRIDKPLCWTMHDMWPFSGAEHYDDLQSPGRYKQAYAAANRPRGYSGPDLDAWVWRRKRKAWSNKHFQLISPSRWLAACAKESALFARQSCAVIPNCVDTDIFKLLDRTLARQVFNLEQDKRYVLFGAMNSVNDKRKGFQALQEALHRLSLEPGVAGKVELLVFGSQAPQSPPDFGLPVHYLGTLHDDISLALLYNAADVFVAPSLQDNLPNTLVESQACGTPCVAFDIGGMPDLIDHGVTGYLARPDNAEDLAKQIFNVLFSQNVPRENMRQKAMRTYSEAVVAAQYENLYRLVKT
jgi:glycosyltransferase involved in cell wall biosynthesis